MQERRKVRIDFLVPRTLEINTDQVVVGRAIIGHVETEVTSQLTEDRLPENLREDFKKGNLRIFNTDIDAWVIVRIGEGDSSEIVENLVRRSE